MNFKKRHITIIVATFAAFLNIACSEKPTNKVEVLLPRQCATEMVDALKLHEGNDVVEYVLFDMNTPLGKVLPGYLRIESSIRTKDQLVAVANRLTSLCLPEEVVEFSANVNEEVVGSAVSSFIKKPRNKLIIVFKNNNYRIMGHELREQ